MTKRPRDRDSGLRMKLILLCAGVVLPLLTASLSRAQAIPQMTGIFSIDPGASASLSSTSTISPSILAAPYVKGILVRFGWSDIETAEGVYDWSVIDGLLSQAAASGQQITLGVMAGYLTPSWVYADGAQRFNFVWGRSDFRSAALQRAVYPDPELGFDFSGKVASLCPGDGRALQRESDAGQLDALWCRLP